MKQICQSIDDCVFHYQTHKCVYCSRESPKMVLEKRLNNLCEWDPELKQPAALIKTSLAENRKYTLSRPRGCKNQAVWVLGVTESWRLCNECARLSEFLRYTVRRKIDDNE